MKPPAPAPPKGFRPHMPIKVKLEAVLINGPVLDAEGNRVCSLEDINFDHQPPLMARVFDPEKWDTIPPANDPSHIVPLAKPVHGEKTAKVDIPQIAKTKRLANDHEEFRRKILSRECGEKRQKSGKIQGRRFQRRVK